MKNTLSFAGLGGIVSLVVACSGSSGTDPALGQVQGEVRIDVRCVADTDCPSGFECESETENGVATSFCKSHGGSKAPDAVNGEPLECETEVEHGVTTTNCHAHGGDHADGGANDKGGSDDTSGSGKHSGTDDGSGHH